MFTPAASKYRDAFGSFDVYLKPSRCSCTPHPTCDIFSVFYTWLNHQKLASSKSVLPYPALWMRRGTRIIRAHLDIHADVV